MVVTMDNWNLFTHVTMGVLRGMITEELSRKGIDAVIIDGHPYTIVWGRELEMGIQVMDEKPESSSHARHYARKIRLSVFGLFVVRVS